MPLHYPTYAVGSAAWAGHADVADYLAGLGQWTGYGRFCPNSRRFIAPPSGSGPNRFPAPAAGGRPRTIGWRCS
jgi:hypothetical protein